MTGRKGEGCMNGMGGYPTDGILNRHLFNPCLIGEPGMKQPESFG